MESSFTPFENQQLDIQLLPKAESLTFELVSPEIRTVQYIWLTVFFIFYLIIATGILAISGNILNLSAISIAFLPLLIITGLSSILIYRGYFLRGYAIREFDFAYKHGIIFRSETIIPYNNIQHCEIGQGPVERIFNLSHLNLYTAGSMQAEISVRGLSMETGEQLREFILNKLTAKREEN